MSIKIKPEHLSEAVNRATLELADKGELVAGGFAGFIQAAYGDPRHLPYDQLKALRSAFFAASQHMFASICEITMSGSEQLCEERMCKIAEELGQFLADFAKEHGMPPPPKVPRIRQ